jgi:hypothetical protein
MARPLRLSMMAMLGAGALFTGGVVWYAWERVWLWRRLPPPRFCDVLEGWSGRGQESPSTHLLLRLRDTPVGRGLPVS